MISSGGNIENVGDNIEKLIKNNEISDEDRLMLAYWQLVDEKIPCQFEKKLQKMLVNKTKK